MKTREEAMAVKDAIQSEMLGKSIGLGLTYNEKGGWYVMLMLPHEFPDGELPSEKDGVGIVSEVTGPFTAYAQTIRPE